MAAEDETALMRALPIFAGVEPEALRILTFSTVSKTLRPGDVLFKKGEYSDGGYLVLDGEIEIDPTLEEIDNPPALFGKGALIGQLGLFIRLQRPGTAKAKLKTTTSFISRELMHKILISHPESAARICKNVAKDMARFVQKLDNIPI